MIKGKERKWNPKRMKSKMFLKDTQMLYLAIFSLSALLFTFIGFSLDTGCFVLRDSWMFPGREKKISFLEGFHFGEFCPSNAGKSDTLDLHIWNKFPDTQAESQLKKKRGNEIVVNSGNILKFENIFGIFTITWYIKLIEIKENIN